MKLPALLRARLEHSDTRTDEGRQNLRAALQGLDGPTIARLSVDDQEFVGRCLAAARGAPPPAPAAPAAPAPKPATPGVEAVKAALLLLDAIGAPDDADPQALVDLAVANFAAPAAPATSNVRAVALGRRCKRGAPTIRCNPSGCTGDDCRFRSLSYGSGRIAFG